MPLRAGLEARDDMAKYKTTTGYEDNLRTVLSVLSLGNKINGYPDRELKGNLAGYRECVFRDGFVLLYKVDEEKETIFISRAAPYHLVCKLYEDY